jgi:hypothetical protein
VGEFFLQPGRSQRLTVGTAEGVDFVLDEPQLRSPKFELLRADEMGFTVRFTEAVGGQLIRGDAHQELTALVRSGRLGEEEGAYALTLGGEDLVVLRLGGIRVEVSLEPVPKPVWVPWQESVDFAALNIFLVIFFLASLFVLSAIHRDAAGDAWVDELQADSRIVKLIPKAPEVRPRPTLSAQADRPTTAAATAGASGTPGKTGKPGAPNRPSRMAAPGKADVGLRARSMMADLFPNGRTGIHGLFSEEAGGEMRRALADLRRGPVGDSTGVPRLSGTGTVGDGPGSSTVGIYGLGTRYGRDHLGGDRAGSAILGEKKGESLPHIVNDDVQISGIDPELIRRVIHSHRDQVRFCYELELNSHPSLSGKVKVRFVIVEGGVVSETSVAESTVGSPRLETCLMDRVRSWNFPLPKRSGMAVVSYPFLLKQAGD